MKFSNAKQHTKHIEKARRDAERQARKEMRLAASNGDWQAAQQLALMRKG